MSGETTLLPCPFCGGEASVRVLEYGGDCRVWGVFCESDLESEYSHGHYVDNYPTEAEAIAAWNTRAERGACKLEKVKDYERGYTITAWGTLCSSCGAFFEFIDGSEWNCCPNCGGRAKAVKR